MRDQRTRKKTSGVQQISDRFIEEVASRLRENLKVRRALPSRGRLYIDRSLPFLMVYRRPARRRDGGTERFVVGEASYMIAPGGREHHETLSALVRAIAEIQARRFGAFLLVEVWAAKPAAGQDPEAGSAVDYVFGIDAPSEGDMSRVAEALEWGLKRMKVDGHTFSIRHIHRKYPCPVGKKPLLSPDDCRRLNLFQIGMELPGIYFDSVTGDPYPILHRRFHRRLSRVFKMGFYEFARFMTTKEPPSYHALGRRAMVKAVWEVDRQLSEVDGAFDFLLMASPSNPDQAWSEFRGSRYERTPEFLYRPVPVDPSMLKRSLYRIPLEKVEDPTIAYVFREKQEELDKLISMLSDRGSKRFLYGSLQVFGGVSEDLYVDASKLLDSISRRAGNGSSRDSLNAASFALLARKEIEQYRENLPDFDAKVEVREDVLGLLVSRDQLLVGKTFRTSAERAGALLQHEVGTHLLTYINATMQPFRLLKYGLAGYSDLQEGLAVLAEYFSGGLTPSRVRLMAARVVAIYRMLNGANFVDVFRDLVQEYGFSRKVAYRIAVKTFRGGGLTKDAVYLRGLISLLKYLEKGGDIDILFLGKVNHPHLPVIRELLHRKVLKLPALRPHYMNYPGTRGKLDLLREGLSVADLLKQRMFR